MKTALATAFMLGMLMAVNITPCAAGVGTVTDETFHEEVLRSDRPVVVDFWRENCPPCRRMEGVVEDLAEEYGGLLKVVRMDTDRSDEIVRLYEIDRVPTFILYKGGYEAARTTGSMSMESLKEELGIQ